MLQIKSLMKMITYKSAIITYIMTVNKLFLLHFHWSNLNCDFNTDKSDVRVNGLKYFFISL